MATFPLWLILASAQEPAPLVLDRSLFEPDRSLFEIVRTWTGDELDHMGVGVSALGDVNGDGVSDFILGTMKGAYMFYFGPGSARVVSGRDGMTLYTVRGTEGTLGYGEVSVDCGDAFGDTIAAIGDVDGRRSTNPSASRSPTTSDRSASSRALAVGEGRGSMFGKSIVPLGDVDGDQRAEFLLSDHEGQAGARCGGAVHVVRLGQAWK